MDRPQSNFPFEKLRFFKYAVFDILKNLDYKSAIRFLFKLTKAGRRFLRDEYVALKNEFENEGLITLKILYRGTFKKLEQMYLQTLKKNMDNRILSISIAGK